jgi:hypothetical protein
MTKNIVPIVTLLLPGCAFNLDPLGRYGIMVLARCGPEETPLNRGARRRP